MVMRTAPYSVLYCSPSGVGLKRRVICWAAGTVLYCTFVPIIHLRCLAHIRFFHKPLHHQTSKNLHDDKYSISGIYESAKRSFDSTSTSTTDWYYK